MLFYNLAIVWHAEMKHFPERQVEVVMSIIQNCLIGHLLKSFVPSGLFSYSSDAISLKS